jgi:Replication protein.
MKNLQPEGLTLSKERERENLHLRKSSSLDKSALSRHLGHTCQRDFLTLQCTECGHRRQVRAGSRDRTCPACQRRLYEKTFVHYKNVLKHHSNLKFLTLTWKPVKRQDPSIVRRMGKALTKLLHRKRYVRSWKGLVATVECKKTRSGMFYYHIHAIIEGVYVNQAQISRDWRAISGFPIVHIKAIRRTKNRALRYVLKYVLKGMAFEDPEDKSDFKKSMKGVRVIRSYGSFYASEYRTAQHVYFPCPNCGAVKSWVVLEFCDLVDLFDGEPYAGGNGG